MNLTKWSACGNEIGLARMMPNAVDLTIVLYLMLHDNLISHALVILPDGLC